MTKNARVTERRRTKQAPHRTGSRPGKFLAWLPAALLFLTPLAAMAPRLRRRPSLFGSVPTLPTCPSATPTRRRRASMSRSAKRLGGR